MFDLPFVTLPGDSFSYCSGNYYLLAEILQRTTGMTCHDFAEENPVTNGRLFNLPVALKGSWDNNTLIIHYNELCGLNLLKLSFLSVIHPLI